MAQSNTVLHSLLAWLTDVIPWLLENSHKLLQIE